jgi:hypothetical protein
MVEAAPTFAFNPDIKQVADGSYWMVTNRMRSLGAAKGLDIVAYHSVDGLNRTPWNGGDAALIPAYGPSVQSDDRQCR